MYTVGSAFAVTANAYIKRGGMNRRQAGEEFYFLQELAYQGKIGEIKSKIVFPSARISERAPFGTGQMMKRWNEKTEDLSVTFDFQAFKDLKGFFQKRQRLYKITEGNFVEFCKELPIPISKFLETDNFWKQLKNLNDNCSTLTIFTQRFFHLFNAFKILKFLHYSHKNLLKKKLLTEQAIELERAVANQ
jgi:hypothetical protein